MTVRNDAKHELSPHFRRNVVCTCSVAFLVASIGLTFFGLIFAAHFFTNSPIGPFGHLQVGIFGMAGSIAIPSAIAAVILCLLIKHKKSPKKTSEHIKNTAAWYEQEIAAKKIQLEELETRASDEEINSLKKAIKKYEEALQRVQFYATLGIPNNGNNNNHD